MGRASGWQSGPGRTWQGAGSRVSIPGAQPDQHPPRLCGAHKMGRGPRGFAGHRSRGHPGLGPAWARVGLSTGRGLRAPRRPRGSQVPPLHPEHPAAFRGAVSGRLPSRSPPVHCPPWTGRSVSISRWWAARYRRWASDIPVGAPPPHPRELAPAGPRGLGWSWRGTELPSWESLCPARMPPLTPAPQVQPQVGGQGHCHRETPQSGCGHRAGQAKPASASLKGSVAPSP